MPYMRDTSWFLCLPTSPKSRSTSFLPMSWVPIHDSNYSLNLQSNFLHFLLHIGSKFFNIFQLQMRKTQALSWGWEAVALLDAKSYPAHPALNEQQYYTARHFGKKHTFLSVFCIWLPHLCLSDNTSYLLRNPFLWFL